MGCRHSHSGLVAGLDPCLDHLAEHLERLQRAASEGVALAAPVAVCVLPHRFVARRCLQRRFQDQEVPQAIRRGYLAQPWDRGCQVNHLVRVWTARAVQRRQAGGCVSGPNGVRAKVPALFAVSRAAPYLAAPPDVQRDPPHAYPASLCRFLLVLRDHAQDSGALPHAAVTAPPG